ncbi:hypothetical protein BDZ89DRAFT_428557 [Hymenopellis radicata]|nr:hypothetical protein BDZ89DRAFT_428557 [Hymenopellis radicata]
MIRREGEAAKLVGIGPGLMTKESEENLNKAEQLSHQQRFEESLFYYNEALKDKNNLDAVLQVAALNSDRQAALSILQRTEKRGRELVNALLKEDCFVESSQYFGKFWTVIETRPYIRVLAAICDTSFLAGRVDLTVDTTIRMLRLAPTDEMSQRFDLGSHLSRLRRYAEALAFVQAWMGQEMISKRCGIIPSRHTGAPPPQGGTLALRRKNPKKEPFYTEDEEKDHEWGEAAFLYSAALASFKLWGNCPSAQQYLRLAVKVCPYIMVKILAKVPKPQTPSLADHKSVNGPQEAREYLYWAQDLWMKSSVWEWVNSRPDIKKYVLKNCCRPGCDAVETNAAQYQRCASCKKDAYCSPACQRADWKRHKPGCQAEMRAGQLQHAIDAGLFTL